MKILALLCIVLTTPLMAEAPSKDSVAEATDLAAFLVDASGTRSDKFVLRAGQDALIDLEFKGVVPEKYQFNSWAFEFSDPVKNLSFRVPGSGPVPATVHWNGRFSNGKVVEGGQRCFVRLLLILSDQSLAGSAWTAFTIEEAKVAERVAVAGHTVGMYVVPSGGLEATSIKTQSANKFVFPTVHGDIRFILADKHTLGLRYEQTVNGMFSSPTDADTIYHSDFSVAYRYRLMGKTLRGRSESAIPAAAKFQLAQPQETKGSIQPTAGTEAGTGLQVGGKIFSKMLRGQGNFPIDAELGRNAQGLALTVNASEMLDTIRLQLSAEVGYTVISGKMFLAGAGVGATYEGFNFLSPGLQVRYQILSGTPSDDEFDAGNNSSTSVTNHLIFAGFLLNVKI